MSGEAMGGRTKLADWGWAAHPRHSNYGPLREGGRGHERPSVGPRRRAPIVEDIDRLAAAEPAQRLFQLTDELGRLAGEIADRAKSRFGGDSGPDAKFVRALIRQRQRRVAAFGADLFADPVWDMMLDLLAARLEGRPVSTSSLCIAAGVPSTTALRWIRLLTERGLFVRAPDPRDRRGVLIELSGDTAGRLLAHLGTSTEALLP
jgi:hypothetical protein